jgi:hypothetical protein
MEICDPLRTSLPMTIKGKCPRGPIQLGKQVFDIAIGEGE